MALQKSYTTKSGAVGDYHVIGSFRWEPDGDSRQASALIQLYVSAASATAGKEPLVPIIGKLRLYGDKFDEYLSKEALAASENDIIGQLYLALKDACDLAHASGHRDPLLHVISDCGADFYHDATDV